MRLLVDAAENYPAWLDAIERASRTIYFETYLLHDDSVGQRFADAFGAAARRGVRTYLLYDWLGGIRTRGRFWKRLVEAGVHVRSFNRPRLDNIFGLVNRDHRKLLVIDDALAYVGGLGIGDPWLGNQARRFEPWRDTASRSEVLPPWTSPPASSATGNTPADHH